MPHSQLFEIACYSSGFVQSDRPNMSANSANLFWREP
jgi:hypothetical protein